jgi:hypothetical protein
VVEVCHVIDAEFAARAQRVWQTSDQPADADDDHTPRA